MGNYRSNNKMGHQSPAGGNYFVPGISNWHGYVTTKRPHRTMETKLISLALITADLLGVGWATKLIIDRVNNGLELLIVAILVIYMVFRFYFRIKRDQILMRKEMFEQMEREKKFEMEYKK